ncbi:hypothetical protein DFH09DRAFT_869972, partial [Mycena vulgaris]
FSNDRLVIHTENTVFRVSQSVLAARSSVFRDMGTLRQNGGTEQEMLEGSPVFRPHDSVAQVEVFLRAIFDSNYVMPPPAAVGMQELLGILRFAHKYDVNYLFHRALQHLGAEYPSGLGELGED